MRALVTEDERRLAETWLAACSRAAGLRSILPLMEDGLYKAKDIR